MNFFHIARNLNAKLCFGYGENCQFEMAEKHGNIALEQTPRDIWAIHSMAHVKEESLKSRYIVDTSIFAPRSP